MSRVDSLIDGLLATLDEAAAGLEAGQPVRFAGSPAALIARKLRTAILDPVLEAAGDETRLIIAPDQRLHEISFAMLPTMTGYLADDYEISYVSSGQDLLRAPDETPGAQSDPIVLADPDYDAGRADAGDEGTNLEGFERLPGTRAEGEEIGRLLGVDPLLGEAACKARLQECRSPAIIHVATHGWYLPSGGGPDHPPEWAAHPRLTHLDRSA
jgi:CHAT domain-containing protein